MRALIQRVREASVNVGGHVVGAIGPGILVLAAMAADDGEADRDWLARKIVALRIFDDDAGRFDRSLRDVGGGLLVVSQFTLYGDCRRGRRPSFSAAAPAERARALYERFVDCARAGGVPVATGQFQAHMALALVNDGPVTLLLDTAEDQA